MSEIKVIYSFESQFSERTNFIIRDKSGGVLLENVAGVFWRLHKKISIDFSLRPFHSYTSEDTIHHFTSLLREVREEYTISKGERDSIDTNTIAHFIMGSFGTLAVFTPFINECFDHYAEFINYYGKHTVRKGTKYNMLYPLKREVLMEVSQCYHPIITHLAAFNIKHIINSWHERLRNYNHFGRDLCKGQIALWEKQLDAILPFLPEKDISISA